jgi:uncharacterized oxidoreductase
MKKNLFKVKQLFPDITTFVCDVGDARQREKLAADVISRFPDLDILVNNAGIQRYIDLKKGYAELKNGQDEISINFTALVELSALFITHLLTKPAAAIVNVSSALGFAPIPRMPIYCATKAAVHTYSLVLRQQLKDTSLKVVEIVPPFVATNLNAEGRKKSQHNARGISVAEFMPTILKGLENDLDTIFHGDGEKVVTEPRGKTESRLLAPGW